MKSPAKGSQKAVPKVRPLAQLVQALNDTNLVDTFSSCQGNLEGYDQQEMDQTIVDIRFYGSKMVSDNDIQTLMEFIITKAMTYDLEVFVDAYKKYKPHQHILHSPIYVLKIRPCNSFDDSLKKRKDIDAGVKAVTEIVQLATKIKEEGMRLIPIRGGFAKTS
ncbi:MAG TPA: hypothetical protein VGM30_24925 [Puia sp.]|jgi:hypothetical protein